MGEDEKEWGDAWHPGPAAGSPGGSDEPEQPLAAGGAEPGEADLVDAEFVAADDLEDAADGVVGDGAIAVLDEFDGGEAADPMAGSDGRSTFPVNFG